MQQLITAMSALMQQNTALVAAMTQTQAAPMYNVLPDLSHNLAGFDRLSGSASAKVWLKQLEPTVT